MSRLVAPYEHEYGGVATWLVVQGKRFTGEIFDGTETAILLRFFKGPVWVAAGATTDGKLQVMIMFNFWVKEVPMFKSILLTGVLLLATAVVQAYTIEMKVNGLVCAFCARGIEKTFYKNPAVADVVVSLEDRLVAVQTKEGTDISDHELRTTLTEAGYDVKSIERTETPVAAIRERLKNSPK